MDWHNQSFNRTSTATQRPPVNSALCVKIGRGPLRKIANWWHGKYVDSTLENVLGETDEGEGYVQRPAIVRASHAVGRFIRSEEHTSELQSRGHLVCRLLLEKKKVMR